MYFRVACIIALLAQLCSPLLASAQSISFDDVLAKAIDHSLDLKISAACTPSAATSLKLLVFGPSAPRRSLHREITIES